MTKKHLWTYETSMAQEFTSVFFLIQQNNIFGLRSMLLDKFIWGFLSIDFVEKIFRVDKLSIYRF